jgi:nitroreductase
MVNMDVLECIKTRRSVRNYTGRDVSTNDLEEIISCGGCAPSARGLRPWEFIVVREKEKLVELSKTCNYGRFLAQVSAAIIVVCEDTKYWLEDGCAATQNILLAVHALGYGGCWIAGDKKSYAQEVLDLVQAPKGCRLVSIISIGTVD